MRAAAAVLASAASVLLASAASVVVPATLPAEAATEDGFVIADPRITESSGLATSRSHRHTVWTANDSGDSARVFAVDTRTGQTVGTHAFGAPVRDVEALALGPDGRLFVGDIGDNTASRELVRVFWFDEPALGESSGRWASWELAYPDGPRDAEALLVDPDTGRLGLVSKGPGAGIYLAPATPSRIRVNPLERVADAPAGVTDGVYLPDGRVALRGYLTLTLLDAQTWRVESTHALPLQPQGESIALADDGRSLLVGSEGTGSAVLRVPVPAIPATTGPTTVPVPTSLPPAVRPPPRGTPASGPPTSAQPGPSSASRPDTSPEDLPSGPRLLAAGIVAGVMAGIVAVGGAGLARWWRRSRSRA